MTKCRLTLAEAMLRLAAPQEIDGERAEAASGICGK